MRLNFINTQLDPKKRFLAGIIIILAFSLISNIKQSIKMSKLLFNNYNNDLVSMTNDHFRQIKSFLAGKTYKVLFISDKSFDKNLLLYSLTPIIPDCITMEQLLKNESKYQYIIGDFKDKSAKDYLLSNQNWILIKDYGDGLYLFRSEKR